MTTASGNVRGNTKKNGAPKNFWPSRFHFFVSRMKAESRRRIRPRSRSTNLATKPAVPMAGALFAHRAMPSSFIKCAGLTSKQAVPGGTNAQTQSRDLARARRAILVGNPQIGRSARWRAGHGVLASPPMATERQIPTNHPNAKKNIGPHSDADKAAGA